RFGAGEGRGPRRSRGKGEGWPSWGLEIPSPPIAARWVPLSRVKAREREKLCYKAPMNAIPPAQPRHVTIGNITVGNDRPLALIAGPCALESRAHALEMCQALVEMTAKLGMGLVYKTSFDKANRTSIEGARGLGLEKGLPIMAELRERFGVPVLTDVHAPEQ